MNRTLVIALPLLLYMSFLQDRKPEPKTEKAFDADINDSTSIQIDLHYNNRGLPQQYVSHVVTPVCKDGLCYLMVIDIYWDLLGNFHKYELQEDHPLTKFDHVEFTEEDHKKMKKILSNKDSFLRFYSLENLIDPTETRESDVVDGESGATHKSLQSDVVSGAVFSTYVLWHIVNGPIAQKIIKHTEDRFDDGLMVQLLGSDNYHYQYYALNRITEANNSNYLPQIIRLISEGTAYVPYFAVEKIPIESWESPDDQAKIISLIKGLNFEMQNELLNRITAAHLHENALNVLISTMEELKESQQIKALNIVAKNKTRISDKSKSQLLKLLKHPNKEIASQANSILKGG